MIRTPELALECIAQAKNATTLPVSVKTRLGYTELAEFKGWLPLLLKQDLAALTVHLRTRKEMSKVPAHYELIPEIVELCNTIAPQTKLIINGDIKNLQQVRELAQTYPGVDGFMIGRGVFENPYCFTDHQPSQQELLELLHLHLDLFDAEDAKHVAAQAELIHNNPEFALKMNGEVRSLPFEPLKHFFKIYINNFPGASTLRAQLMETHTTDEVRKILQNR